MTKQSVITTIIPDRITLFSYYTSTFTLLYWFFFASVFTVSSRVRSDHVGTKETKENLENEGVMVHR